MKRSLTLVALLLLPIAFLFAIPAHADSIPDIMRELKQESVLPFHDGAAHGLATNIYDAQLAASYASPTSLELSIESVLRAIWLEDTLAGETYVGTANYSPLPWLQSTIAIDPGATIVITPSSLNFGDVPVTTPELPTLILLILGLLGLIGLKRTGTGVYLR